MKVLILSHGHPAFSIGGAEVAYYNLFKGLNRSDGCEAHYLARVGPPVSRHRDTPFMSLRQNARETLFYANDYDYYRLSNRDLANLRRDFSRFLCDVRPDVVNLHHVLGFGVEAIRVIRETLPEAKIVFTLHEYLSICNNHGLMINARGGQLCKRATPGECNVCFPGISPAQFMRRELFLRSFFDQVDMFVSPSRFLIERYVTWGLPREKMVMLENGLDIGEIAPPRPLAGTSSRRSHFAYFGQLNQFKGIKVLSEAIVRIPANVWGNDAILNVYGGNLEVQPEAFQQEFKRLVAAAGRRVRFFGSYRSPDLPMLMRDIDWVIVPSTWWENSPVVIQEAFLHGRPILCSDIGGMAEKVRNTVDGLHFRAGSAESLVDRITLALSAAELWERLRARIRKPVSAEEAAQQHQTLFRTLIEAQSRHQEETISALAAE